MLTNATYKKLKDLSWLYSCIMTERKHWKHPHSSIADLQVKDPMRLKIESQATELLEVINEEVGACKLSFTIRNGGQWWVRITRRSTVIFPTKKDIYERFHVKTGGSNRFGY